MRKSETNTHAGDSIRQAYAEDIPAILALEKEAPHITHWSEHSYRAVFSQGAPDRAFLVYEHQHELRGFLVARFGPAECELENIVVAEEHRRRGIGSRLLAELVSAARSRRVEKILLEARQSNASARHLYSKFGFVEYGRRKSYYANPAEDAILYALNF